MRDPALYTVTNDELLATMRGWGIPYDDPGAQYWPAIADFIERADDALNVLEPERRERAVAAALSGPDGDMRSLAFAMGAFWEVFAVAHDERLGAPQ